MNLQKMMKQAQEMQTKFASLQEEIGHREMEGSAGGGMVKAVVSGKGELRKLDIDPKIIDADEKEMLEDLVIAAFNDAKTKMDESANEEMQKMTNGMGLPPGMKMPF
ncbi:MAG: YbaB/EbfC family nucleoid-associated protein [Alphaproteobacteria bacterium]|nr:YbaB/EbfC family nucleoid-associated protein [Alphaproteobacteria bacterium]